MYGNANIKSTYGAENALIYLTAQNVLRWGGQKKNGGDEKENLIGAASNALIDHYLDLPGIVSSTMS